MRRPRRGANAVEFALLMPFFLIFLGVFMELSWLLFQRGSVHSAVERSCRSASMIDPGLGESDLEAVLSETRASILERYEATAGDCEGCLVVASLMGSVPQRSLFCSLKAPHSSISSLLGDRSMTLGAVALVRLEHQRRIE